MHSNPSVELFRQDGSDVEMLIPSQRLKHIQTNQIYYIAFHKSTNLAQQALFSSFSF